MVKRLTPEQIVVVAQGMTAVGYRRTSNRHRMVARIDRHDWREVMAYQHAPWDPLGEGMDWANGLGMADYYRRCHSKDVQTVSPEVFSLIPGSGGTESDYIAAPWEKPRIALLPDREPPLRPRWRCTNRKGEFADGPSPEAARLALQEMPR